jgi:hypothetical protein
MNTMQFVQMILNWLQADPTHVWLAFAGLSALTPTPDPNTPLGKLYKIVDLLALNVLHAKETGTSPTPDALASQVAAILEQKKPAAPATPPQP